MFRATGLHLSSQATECDGFIANASNAVLGLDCIQMMLYFSLEDGSKKMAGTEVVSQSGTDLERGKSSAPPAWGPVRQSE